MKSFELHLYLFYIIISAIILIELYLRYKIETFEQSSINISEPWDKMIVGNNSTKYYIKLKKFNEQKFLEWKAFVNNIDFDIDEMSLMIKTNKEAEALVIANLFISNLNDTITLNEIIEQDLINRSMKKAKSHKLVVTKLIELIKQGIDTDTFISSNTHIDMVNSDTPPQINHIKESLQNEIHPVVVQNAIPLDKVMRQPLIAPYEGSEYASL